MSDNLHPVMDKKVTRVEQASFPERKSVSEKLHDIKKYWGYYFETKPFTSYHTVRLSEHSIQAARHIRGIDRGPAVLIHGIMPRSGTVYAGELLRRHPDLSRYPHQLWEFPALQLTNDVLNLQKNFLQAYRKNRDKLETGDFLPLFGASLIAFLYESVPPGKRALAKMPSVQYLNYFFSMFPHENLLVLLRDGRDLIHSTLRTWPNLNFIQVCLRWNRSAQVILNTFNYPLTDRGNGYWITKYEDALLEPEAFVREACRHLNLDEDAYPYEKIKWIGVIGSSTLASQNQDKVDWRQKARPENFKPIGYWKKWSNIRKQVFKVIAGQSMIRLGYCQDLNW